MDEKDGSKDKSADDVNKKNVSYGRLIKKLTTVQASYIAGLIDGEGYVTVVKKNDYTGMKRGVCYRAMISITNTNESVLVWLLEKTGLGSIKKSGLKKSEKVCLRRKQGYVWSIWSQQARQLLEVVRPYLVIKQKQADLLLDFFSKIKKTGRGGLSDAEWQQQVEIHEKLRKINKRSAGEVSDEDHKTAMTVCDSKRKKIKLLTDCPAGYIAGILDGEGWLTISKKKYKTGASYRPRVGVGNTNVMLLNALKDLTGLGAIWGGGQKSPNHKASWQWNVWSRQSEQLPKIVHPYLLIKLEQANVLLEFIDKIKPYRGCVASLEYWAYQEESWLKIKKLNKRGVQ